MMDAEFKTYVAHCSYELSIEIGNVRGVIPTRTGHNENVLHYPKATPQNDTF